MHKFFCTLYRGLRHDNDVDVRSPPLIVFTGGIKFLAEANGTGQRAVKLLLNPRYDVLQLMC